MAHTRILVVLVAAIFMVIGVILIADAFNPFGAGLYDVRWGEVRDVLGLPLGQAITLAIGVMFVVGGIGVLYDVMIARIILLLLAGCYMVFGLFLMFVGVSRAMADLTPWLRAGIVGSAMMLKGGFTFWVLFWIPNVMRYHHPD